MKIKGLFVLVCALFLCSCSNNVSQDKKSGALGENISWSISENTLFLTGEGEMENFDSYGNTPWKPYQSTIEKIIVEDGIVSVGDYAFAFCKNVRQAVLPKLLKSIGDYAFLNCVVLENADIPKECESIGRGAFEGCAGMRSVSIAEGIKSLGETSFDRCTLLESIDVSDANSVYYSENGVLFNKDKTVLLCYPAGRTQEEYVLPDSVARVAKKAFSHNQNLVYVDLNMANIIEESAFSSTKSLREINLPAGITEIPEKAFFMSKNLENIEMPKGVERIRKRAFSGCMELKSVSIPLSVCEIEEYAFSGCSALSDVSLSDRILNLSSHIFSDCISLESVRLPRYVEKIGEYAFSGCKVLDNLYIPYSVLQIYENAFKGCNTLRNIFYEKDAQAWQNIDFAGGNTHLTTSVVSFSQEYPEEIY